MRMAVFSSARIPKDGLVMVLNYGTKEPVENVIITVYEADTFY